MTFRSLLASTALVAAATINSASAQEMAFKRVASFPVNLNIPSDMDQKSVSSSEIISATEDGMMVVYSDSPLGGIGMVDISNPSEPKAAGFVKLEGEPTAVSVKAGRVLVGLNTSESFTNPSGKLVAINLETKQIETTCDLGGQPDSTAISPDGTRLAIAIENERDEDLNDGEIPQMPAGYVTLFGLSEGTVDCGSMIKVELTGLAEVAGDDPEPEFVDFNNNNELAVTMQENNHLVILNGETGEIISNFSAGAVTLEDVDTEEEGALTFDGSLENINREPDAVQWLDNDRIVIANEGDYNGGSRSFTIFGKDGSLQYESGLSFEYEVAMAGHYPEARSGNKGVEPEGMEIAKFGDDTFIFLLSERGSVVGVYRDNGAGQDPTFMQLLPSALAPEGAIAIPARSLLVVANEADLIEDGGVRSHVTIYERGEGAATYPHIVSMMDGARPVGFGALSGLAADPEQAGILYAVNDSFYAMQPSIFTIDTNQAPAKITNVTRITRGGANAQLLDLEGIASDGEGGFWLASEGRSDSLIPHALYHVNAEGEIKASVAFPPELLAVEKRFGAEGVTKIGDTLWVAIQREWGDDEDGFVKLVAYNTDSKEWGAVRYPLEPKGEGWMGLSEISVKDDLVYIIERDNQIGAAAKVKRIYSVPVDQLNPVALGGELPVVEKTLVVDLIPEMQKGGGYVVDKVEGFTIDPAGNAFAVTDNDGVDDSNGETQFLRLGDLRKGY